MKRSDLPAQFKQAQEKWHEERGYYILRAPCGCHAARSQHDRPEEWCAYRGYHRCDTHGGGTEPFFQGSGSGLRVGGGITAMGLAFHRMEETRA